MDQSGSRSQEADERLQHKIRRKTPPIPEQVLGLFLKMGCLMETE